MLLSPPPSVLKFNMTAKFELPRGESGVGTREVGRSNGGGSSIPVGVIGWGGGGPVAYVAHSSLRKHCFFVHYPS